MRDTEEDAEEDHGSVKQKKTKVYVRRNLDMRSQRTEEGSTSSTASVQTKAVEKELGRQESNQKFTLLYPFFKYDNALQSERQMNNDYKRKEDVFS